MVHVLFPCRQACLHVGGTLHVVMRRGRFELLIPVLEPEYVADRIITAVRRNEEVVVTPRVLYSSYAVVGDVRSAATGCRLLVWRRGVACEFVGSTSDLLSGESALSHQL